MPRRSSYRTALTTIHLPADIGQAGEEAAREATLAHVHNFVGIHRGNITKLAVACYLQGLMDATHMTQEYPGWPRLTLHAQEQGQ
jgi:hypothetical protein